MSIREKYEEELMCVYDNLVRMCRHIESSIEKCITALKTGDKKLAHEVCEDEVISDKFEREIEQSCLKILLLEHPVARDFRSITASLKMITDLERIGDQARDIAEMTIQFSDADHLLSNPHISEMADIVSQMIKDSVHSYINRDSSIAVELERSDDRVDELFKTLMLDMSTMISQNPHDAMHALMLMMIAKYLERIGDHAVNIGEWAEFSITGIHSNFDKN